MGTDLVLEDSNCLIIFSHRFELSLVIKFQGLGFTVCNRTVVNVKRGFGFGHRKKKG